MYLLTRTDTVTGSQLYHASKSYPKKTYSRIKQPKKKKKTEVSKMLNYEFQGEEQPVNIGLNIRGNKYIYIYIYNICNEGLEGKNQILIPHIEEYIL